MISRLILKPIELIYLALFKVSFVVQKKPLIGSVEPAIGHASRVAPQLIKRLKKFHSKPTPPPFVYREPTENSALPSRTGDATAGTLSGSCWRSASMHSMVGLAAFSKPKSTALLRPRHSERFR